jgi:DNA-binding NtrC family response regulator
MFESFSIYRMSQPIDPDPGRVLVADDQPDILEALRWLLTAEGYQPQFVSSTDAVMERLKADAFDLLLMDLNYSRDTTSGREGLELIPRVRAHDPGLPIVVMTGWGSIDTAVEAMRRGAKSFVQKPWEDVTLLEILQREIAEARAARRRDERVRFGQGTHDPVRLCVHRSHEGEAARAVARQWRAESLDSESNPAGRANSSAGDG